MKVSALLLLAVIAVAGCGGGGDSPAGQTAGNSLESSAVAGASPTKAPEAVPKQWPVSLILARTLSQTIDQCIRPSGNPDSQARCTAGRKQTAELAATGGTTNFTPYNFLPPSSLQWQMRTGFFTLIKDVFGDPASGGVTCNEGDLSPPRDSVPGTATPAPYYAQIGQQGELLRCQRVGNTAGYLELSQTIFRWRVAAADTAGMARVCITKNGVDVYCGQGDESGNIDTSIYPWVTSSVPSFSSTTALQSLTKMLDGIQDGRSFVLPTYRNFTPGRPTIDVETTPMTVTGRLYSDGSRGLDFSLAGELKYGFRMRLDGDTFTRWTYHEAQPLYGFLATTEGVTIPVSSPTLNDPLGVDASTADIAAVAGPPGSLGATRFLVTADRNQTCLGAFRTYFRGGNGFRWCWSHDLARASAQYSGSGLPVDTWTSNPDLFTPVGAGYDLATADIEWPVSLILARGLSYSDRTPMTDSRQTQLNVSLTATGGTSEYKNLALAPPPLPNLSTIWNWSMQSGHFVLDRETLFGPSGTITCAASERLQTPHYGRIGMNFAARSSCMQTDINGTPIGTTFESGQTVSLRSSKVEGMVQVCFADLCFRGDRNGALDTTKQAWVAE